MFYINQIGGIKEVMILNQIPTANGTLTISNCSVFFLTVGGCFFTHELCKTIKYLAKEDKITPIIMAFTQPKLKYETLN